ncbi:hypothetical protein VTK56DRAFT_7298 [Thermocarpiscus australiensis]
MEKKHFASLLEDHSPGPGAGVLRPLSPFRNGRRSGSRGGDGGSPYGSTSHTGLDLKLDLDQDQQQVLSCVAKETSHEDCARHRFIVWAAVKRNSSVRLPPEQRLECPLLRCTQRFSDHEAMLKHLAACRWLAAGEYWCYDHNRVERFDDPKCKRCLGHPSRRRKILYMAKRFFHSLGHRSKKDHGLRLDDDEALLAPPPSYDSLGIPSPRHELPSTEILEIDSVEVPVTQPRPVPASSDAIDPQALLMPMPVVPALPELDSTVSSNETFIQWHPVSGVASVMLPTVQQDDGASRSPVAEQTFELATVGLHGRRAAPRPSARPAPAVPRSKGLSPSSSVRSTASTDTNASTMTTTTTTSMSSMTSMTSIGSSIVSPVSSWSGEWSMGSGLDTHMTSPVDGILADDLFADAVNGCDDPCPEFLHDFFCELPAELPMPKAVCEMVPAPDFGFEPPAAVNTAFIPDAALAEDTPMLDEADNREVGRTNACCSETKSLVSSAWDALQEHIVSSMAKIQDCRDNHLANQLCSMSTRTVATTGLRMLRELIHGRQPTSASDTLCLVHLVYAFSLVLHEQGSLHRFNSLFLQSLTYANAFQPNDRDSYRRMVVSIWQPPDVTQADINNHLEPAWSRSFSSSPGSKGKAPEAFDAGDGRCSNDSLLAAARDFLDELEITVVFGQGPLPLDVQISDLHITHLKDSMNNTGPVNEALLATVKSVLDQLSRGFGDGSLDSRLREVYQKLISGTSSSVRRIEIELLYAGKNCLPTTRFFCSFVSRVRSMCDQIYEQHDVGTSRRDVYHGLGIALIESLIPEFDIPTGRAANPPLEGIDALFNDLNSDAGNATEVDLRPVDLHMFDRDANRAQPPAATSTPEGTPSSAQTGSLASEHARQSGSGESSKQQQPTGQKVEADSCCEICGYRPKGDPQWFKGSMAKHKKLQHSTEPPKIYKCPYPGCTSQYRNRPDNLRQHQIEKNHWVGERPNKRRRAATEGD